MVNITLHSFLGEKFGKNWSLDVSSVSEALHAINTLTNNKLYHTFLENDKKDIGYEVIINNKKVINKIPMMELNETTLQELKTSELIVKNNKIKTIDLVPVIKGAEDVLLIIAGVLLIAIDVIFVHSGYLTVAGIGLIAGGIINLLSSPPKFEDFTQGRIRNSYLFAGPQNTTREGGPVIVNYGRLIGGSHVISASYEVTHIDADINKSSSL